MAEWNKCITIVFILISLKFN